MCDKKLVHCNWTLLKTHSPNLHDIPTSNTHKALQIIHYLHIDNRGLDFDHGIFSKNFFSV